MNIPEFIGANLFFASYILVPLLFALLLKKEKIRREGLTYIFTAIILIAYPFLIALIFFPDPPTPADAGPGDGMAVVLLILMWIIGTPTSLLIQLIFNRILIRKSK